MRMDHELKNRTRNLLAMANLAMAAIICLVPCHVSAGVFEDGQYWIGEYMADPVDIQPGIDSGQLVMDGNTWTQTGQYSPGGSSYTEIITIDSLTPMADGYYQIQGQENGEAVCANVAVTPTLACEADASYTGDDLGITIILPKAVNPDAAGLDGHWAHISFRTEVDGSQKSAESQIEDIQLDATLLTGTHQNSGGDSDDFSWSLDPASSVVTVDMGQDISFEIGVGNGGLMFRAGPEIGGSDPNELSWDMFVKTGSSRDAQDAVGRYAVQMLESDAVLAEWNTNRGILSLNADGSFHVDLEPDAMGLDSDGSSEDGTWSMDGQGCITFYQDTVNLFSGHLSLTGDVIVAVDSGVADDRSLIVATHVVPEPSILLLLISAGPGLLFVRRGFVPSRSTRTMGDGSLVSQDTTAE